MSYTYGSVTNCKVGNGTTRSEYQCRLGYQVNSQSIENNTSNVTLRLEVRSTSSSYATYGYNQTTKIDGTSLSAKSFDMRSTNTWQTFGERTITVTHNVDGSYSASKSGSFTTTASGTYSLKSGSASVNVAPATIPRYFSSTPTISVARKTTTSVTINWTTSETCSTVQYKIGDGSWVDVVADANAKSGSYTITGLSPNTNYTIYGDYKRRDSGLWSQTKPSVNVTTYAKTTPTISLSSKTVNSITVTSGCNVAVSSTEYRIKTSSGSYGSYQTSATFSGLTPNTTYVIEVKKVGTDSGESGTATLTVTTYQIATISASNFNLGDNFTINITNPSGQSIEFFMETLNGTTKDQIIRVENTSSGSRTITLNDNELDTIYKKINTGTSTTIRVGVRTIGTYYDWKDVTCTLTGNQKTGRVNISNSWKRGKFWININGTWRRAVQWININGTWKKTI